MATTAFQPSAFQAGGEEPQSAFQVLYEYAYPVVGRSSILTYRSRHTMARFLRQPKHVYSFAIVGLSAAAKTAIRSTNTATAKAPVLAASKSIIASIPAMFSGASLSVNAKSIAASRTGMFSSPLFASGAFNIKGYTLTNSSTYFVASVVAAKIKAGGNALASTALKSTLAIDLASKLGFTQQLRFLTTNLVANITGRTAVPTVKAALKAIGAAKITSRDSPSGSLVLTAKVAIKAKAGVISLLNVAVAIGRSAILVYRLRRINPRFYRPRHIISTNNPPGSISLVAAGAMMARALLKPLIAPGLVFIHPNPLRRIKPRKRIGGRPLRRRYPFQFEQAGYTVHHSLHYIRRILGSTRKKKIYPSFPRIGLFAIMGARAKARNSVTVKTSLAADAALKIIVPSSLVTGINNLISLIAAGTTQLKSLGGTAGKVNLSARATARSGVFSGINTALVLFATSAAQLKSSAQSAGNTSLIALTAATVMARNVVTNISATVALLAAGAIKIKALDASSGKVSISAQTVAKFNSSPIVTNIATLVAAVATGASQVKATAAIAGTVGLTARTMVVTATQLLVSVGTAITATVLSTSRLVTGFVGKVGLLAIATLSLQLRETPTAILVARISAQLNSNVVQPVVTAGLSSLVGLQSAISAAALITGNFPVALMANISLMWRARLSNKRLRRHHTGIHVIGEGGDDNTGGSGP